MQQSGYHNDLNQFFKPADSSSVSRFAFPFSSPLELFMLFQGNAAVSCALNTLLSHSRASFPSHGCLTTVCYGQEQLGPI